MSAEHRLEKLSAADIAEQMESFAANGEWSSVESLSQRLRDAVLDVPETERREMIVALQRSQEFVESLAQHARKDIQGQITTIRRGQSATEAYSSTDRLARHVP